MAQHLLRTHPLVLRRLEVARVADVTPHMRRLTLVGPQLGAFTAGGHAAVADRALVVDALTHSGPNGPDATAEHDRAEHDLLVLGRTGEGRRGPVDVARVAAAVGWRPAGTTSLGWDHEVLELRR